jgi:hypothetical protein
VGYKEMYHPFQSYDAFVPSGLPGLNSGVCEELPLENLLFLMKNK